MEDAITMKTRPTNQTNITTDSNSQYHLWFGKVSFFQPITSWFYSLSCSQFVCSFSLPLSLSFDLDSHGSRKFFLALFKREFHHRKYNYTIYSNSNHPMCKMKSKSILCHFFRLYTVVTDFFVVAVAVFFSSSCASF